MMFLLVYLTFTESYGTKNYMIQSYVTNHLGEEVGSKK